MTCSTFVWNLAGSTTVPQLSVHPNSEFTTSKYRHLRWVCIQFTQPGEGMNRLRATE